MWRAFRPTSHRKATRVIGVCVVLFLGIAASRVLSVSTLPDPTDAHVSLNDIERAVVAIYPVPEISAADAAKALARHDVVLFDVRERVEFQTSHLPGAINIDPDTTAERFLSQHGGKLEGHRVVFYCAVGMRSAVLLQRIELGMARYRAAAAYNLRGGIFRWFAEGREIVNATGPATMIHPYDEAWRRLLQRTLAAR